MGSDREDVLLKGGDPKYNLKDAEEPVRQRYSGSKGRESARGISSGWLTLRE